MCPKGHSKEQAGMGKRFDVCAEVKVIPVKKKKQLKSAKRSKCTFLILGELPQIPTPPSK
jgi:hypothetical protein